MEKVMANVELIGKERCAGCGEEHDVYVGFRSDGKEMKLVKLAELCATEPDDDSDAGGTT